MLQIATGKLFTRPASRENRLRGMLYTNAIFTREDAVETAVGRLFPSSSYSIRPSVLVYEFSERIEGEEHGPGVLVSSGVEPYLQDYSVVVCFALNCVCTPDIDDLRFLGENFRQRERIKRKKLRWAARLAKLDPLERAAIMECLRELEGMNE